MIFLLNAILKISQIMTLQQVAGSCGFSSHPLIYKPTVRGVSGVKKLVQPSQPFVNEGSKRLLGTLPDVCLIFVHF